mgnify:CR=1 FL=1
MPKLHCDASKEFRERDVMESVATSHINLVFCWNCNAYHPKSGSRVEHFKRIDLSSEEFKTNPRKKTKGTK